MGKSKQVAFEWTNATRTRGRVMLTVRAVWILLVVIILLVVVTIALTFGSMKQESRFLFAHHVGNKTKVASAIASNTVPSLYFSKASNVHVLQMGNVEYAKRFENYTRRNEQWASCSGYQYKFVAFEEEVPGQKRRCVYTQKVEIIHQVLEDIQYNDWLIFLDLDATFQGESCDALEKMLPKVSLRDSQSCEIIAHSSRNTINSGVMILRATNFTRHLVRKWYETQEEISLCGGPADQIALQEVLLEEYLPESSGYHGQCKNQERKIPKEYPSLANQCFEERMPLDECSIRQLCAIQCEASPPFQCHDCPKDGSCNVSSAIFWHLKTALPDLPALVQ